MPCLLQLVLFKKMRASDSQESLPVGLELLNMPSPAPDLDKQIQARAHLARDICVLCCSQEKLERIRELSKNVPTEPSEGCVSGCLSTGDRGWTSCVCVDALCDIYMFF